MWSCKHCNEEFNFITTSEKGNHTRWCEKNPNRVSVNLLNSIKNRMINKFGDYKKFDVICNECNTIFIVEERYKLFPSKEKYFCSRNCANSVGGKAKREKYGLTGYVSIAKQFYEEKCIVCGYDELVDVHHINGDRNNNEATNLVFLCPNHHYLLHRKKSEKVKQAISEFIEKKWGQGVDDGTRDLQS